MILLNCKNIQSTPLSCSAAVLNLCSFNSATSSCCDVSMCCQSHGFTWCEFAGQSSPSLNFEMQWNAKLFAQAYVSGLTHSHAYEWKSMELKVQCDHVLRPERMSRSNNEFIEFTISCWPQLLAPNYCNVLFPAQQLWVFSYNAWRVWRTPDKRSETIFFIQNLSRSFRFTAPC